MTDSTNTPHPHYGDLTLTWKWMLGLGILMAVLGVIGLGMTYTLTIVSVLWFGVLVVVGGIAQLIDAFKCSGWKAVVGHALLGLLYLAAGVILIAMPVQSAWWLTLLIGAVFIVTGGLRLVMAFQMRDQGAPALWLGLAAVVSIVLGVMIYGLVEFPTEETVATVETAQAWFTEWGWVIGLFVALEFIMHGAALVALALAAKSTAEGGGTGTAPQS